MVLQSLHHPCHLGETLGVTFPSVGATIWPAAHSFQPGLPLAVLASARCRAQVGLRDGAVQELLAEKDQNISELRETVEILEIKIQKLEQLVRLKDSKIATLQGKLQKYEP